MSDDLVAEAKKRYQKAYDWEEYNRQCAIEDLEFSRASKQWPSDIEKQREQEGRPCLTINKQPSFIRQVVNDARQNKPAIKVHAVDDSGDKDTANVIGGLIRNIERTSRADIAYDTAVDQAASGGFGYIRVGLDYAYEDVFDQDITIERVVNQFSVFGDPDATCADGSTWNNAFVVERYTKEEFEDEWGDKAQVDWDHAAWGQEDPLWYNDDGIMVAEWWKRESYEGKIYQLSNGTVVDDELMADEDVQAVIASGAVQIVKERTVRKYRVIQRFLTAQEVLEEREWPGKYIPIVPVYGEEFWIENKRYLRSLISDAKDPQRMHNYWRTTATELVALAPRVPYIGPKGFTDADPNGWATANTVSHPYLEYKGNAPPQRQPLDSGAAAGAIQEAMMASDDMKQVMGIYDASLGAKSNETSGRAIMARQREGDNSTFHFIDNLARSIRQVGNIVLDLIPHVYNEARIIRVIGEDGREEPVQINEPYEREAEEGVVEAIHDLTAGKYDLTVTSGPSFATKRQEASYEMTEFVRAYPNAAPVIGDLIAKNSDWPDSEQVQERLERLLPQHVSGQQIPPEVQEAVQAGQAAAAELEALRQDKSLEFYKAQTDRMRAEAEIEQKQADADKKVAETHEILETPVQQ